MSRHVTSITWDDVPHLSADAKAALWASIPAYQRDARTRGIPQLGAGVIYPFPESEVRVPDFPIPSHWARAFSLDAQPMLKSHVIGALDRDSQTLYITHAWKRPQAEPAVQVQAIKAVAPWLKGVGDAAALVTDSERTRYIDIYRQLGLDIELAEKGVELGIQSVHELLSQGRLKVFGSCTAFFEEFRLYRRDKRGRVVKVNDHLMDATRYLARAIEHGTRFQTAPAEVEPVTIYESPHSEYGWLG